MKFQKLKGTYDLPPGRADLYQYAEEVITNIVESYGYRRAVFPVIEYVDLFTRGVGESSDIVVKKEMYVFEDRGKRLIALRPEGTASAVRLYLENDLSMQGYSTRMYYTGPMFRAEKPQTGRYRQFYQFGLEYIGDPHPHVDVELIKLNFDILARLGLNDAEYYINSIGCKEDREKYVASLRDYFGDKIAGMCEDCNERYKTNPLRILDCKNESCRVHIDKAPTIVESLCKECGAHFDAVKKGLDRLKVPYRVDPYIVRGLDYYNRTVFEIKHPALGAQSTLLGGGRYDGLVREFGGMDTPAAGFAIGFERLVLALENTGAAEKLDFAKPYRVYLSCIGEEAEDATMDLLYRFRDAGISTVTEYRHNKLKKHLKSADSMQAQYSLLVGEEEIKNGRFILRDMKSGDQFEGSVEEIITKILSQ